MKKASVAVLMVLLGLGFQAWAVPGEITPIEGANLICTYGEGGMVAINATDERVWQGDPGDVDGLELEVVRFDRFRCPNAYDIEARLLVFGEQAPVRMVTSSCGSAKIQLEYTIGDETIVFDCKKP